MLTDEIFPNNSVLIIGGTGTLGKALIDELLNRIPALNITVLSRDEHKQQAIKKRYPRVKCVLGDIRNSRSIQKHFVGKDAVFHVAALKHIDHIEDNPMESVETNIIGTVNVADACEASGVKYCVFSSTDKAVDPINVYGHCKAISERILLHRNEIQETTSYSIYRWGNVLGSNGSCIPFFIDCIKKGRPIPVTDSRMTRFWIDIEQAVRFILLTFDKKRQEVLIPPMMKSASIYEVIEALGEIMGSTPMSYIVGLRKGEKIHEALRSQYAPDPISSDTCERYTRDELKTLLIPIVEAHA